MDVAHLTYEESSAGACHLTEPIKMVGEMNEWMNIDAQLETLIYVHAIIRDEKKNKHCITCCLTN